MSGVYWDNPEVYQDARAAPKKLPTPTIQTSHPSCGSVAANV